MVDAKICGINDIAGLDAAVEAGANFVGFVFYPRSPRNVTIGQAGTLSARLPSHVVAVALSVNPDDSLISSISNGMRVDMFQLHGNESADRVSEIRARTGKQVMKAFRIETERDLDGVEPYLGIVDRLLFDAKAPKRMAEAMPGGNAISFDWRLLAGRRWPLPWMLSGGLDPHNVRDAIRISGAPAVDVSSGVEASPGLKDPARILGFLEAVRLVSPHLP